jgi:hypothetical protein
VGSGRKGELSRRDATYCTVLRSCFRARLVVGGRRFMTVLAERRRTDNQRRRLSCGSFFRVREETLRQNKGNAYWGKIWIDSVTSLEATRKRTTSRCLALDERNRARKRTLTVQTKIRPA